jgi:STIP1 family protein 1
MPPIPNIQSLNTGSISEDDIKTLPKEVQDTILDPITFTIMSDPVINSQGRTYDRSTLMKIIEDGSQSGVPVDPFTRQPISVDIIIPNIAIRDLIQRYFPKAGGKKKQTRKKKSKKKK